MLTMAAWFKRKLARLFVIGQKNQFGSVVIHAFQIRQENRADKSYREECVVRVSQRILHAACKWSCRASNSNSPERFIQRERNHRIYRNSFLVFFKRFLAALLGKYTWIACSLYVTVVMKSTRMCHVLSYFLTRSGVSVFMYTLFSL